MALTDNQSDSAEKVPGVSGNQGALVSDSVFRAYDIRGIAYEQLDVNAVLAISKAIGSEARSMGIETLYVGYDGRISSPELSKALISGLQLSGCNVISLGLIPTPLLYFATHTTPVDSGVMLTASHNPANYNGLKIVFNKTSLAANQIQKIRERITTSSFSAGSGELQELDLTGAYLKDVCERITLQRPLHVVVDCGNAVPGLIAPKLFAALGCTVDAIYCELDGNFPHHHPDPTIPQNLQALADKVRSANADIGLAFDGDGDRLGLVTENGDFVDADKMLMLLTADIAADYPGEAIVFDVKCSKRLAEKVSELGMRPIMHRSGHSFMKQMMEESGAPLGGEYAAHMFLKDRWFGFDDGMYAAARIVEILAKADRPASEIFADFQMPQFSTPEIKLPVDEESKFALMEKIVGLADFPDGLCNYLDGLRVEFEKGWGLIRASNTSPALLMRFEAEDAATMNDIKDRFKALIHSADKSIGLNF